MMVMTGRDVNASQDNRSWCLPLYQAKAAGLVLYGRALGLSHGEAEDVVQETFLALLQMENKPQNPEHYCLRAFRNRALNHHRSLWRRLAREWESVRWFEPASDHDEAEARAMRRLAELPPPQREVIVLKIWHGLTFEAMGTLLGISPNTAAGRYRYGIGKLKACMQGEAYGRDQPVGESIAILDASPPFA
jgi:RNA polymerase sigma-70 factor (ECF subfamily)